ncbi:MAG: hypothetical protein JWO92_1398 [Chitinophagaceae bacterium]|nr:hypothetical protein [Chitinophagaceae bacterium]
MITKNSSPDAAEVEKFLKEIDFVLPHGFIDFFKEANGAEISTDRGYIFLWELTDMIRLNKEYKVDTFAPEFFLFGSDGGGEAYAIEKLSGYIFQIPFIGMNKEDAIFKYKDFATLLESVA